MSNKKNLKAALFAAFPFTVPILAGFLFLGMSYGMLMASCRSYFDKKTYLKVGAVRDEIRTYVSLLIHMSFLFCKNRWRA